MNDQHLDSCVLELSEDDIIKAMKSMKGYLDITPGDFREIYRFAYKYAIVRMNQSITAKDLMTRDVISVNSDTPLVDVAEVLNKHFITGVPVIDGNRKVVGIISEKDFIFHMGTKKEKTFMAFVARCLKGTGCIAVSMRKQTAKDIMISQAISIRENTTVAEIADIFTKNKINRVPVIDNNRELIGMVTRTDIVQSSCSMQIQEK